MVTQKEFERTSIAAESGGIELEIRNREQMKVDTAIMIEIESEVRYIQQMKMETTTMIENEDDEYGNREKHSINRYNVCNHSWIWCWK